jgi:hypothetical protein
MLGNNYSTRLAEGHARELQRHNAPHPCARYALARDFC